MLKLIRKVEIARCANIPLQPSEQKLMHRLVDVSKCLEKSRHLLTSVYFDSEAYIAKVSSLNLINKSINDLNTIDNELKEKILNILNRERMAIDALEGVVS